MLVVQQKIKRYRKVGFVVLGMLLVGCISHSITTRSQSEPLTTREPSFEQLEAYLRSFPQESCSPTIDHTARIVYEDVSGDGNADLIVDKPLQVAVLIWAGDHYTAPFQICHPSWKYAPCSRVVLEDWTNDGTPEVVFDYRGDTGGTGYLYTYWLRHIIYCDSWTCSEGWSGLLGEASSDQNWGGLGLRRTELQLESGPGGSPGLRHLSRGFVVYVDPIWSASTLANIDRVEDFNVLTSTVSSYMWTGSRFELENVQITELPYSIQSQASLTATGENNVSAAISVERVSYPTYTKETCQLYAAGKAVDSPFVCRSNFTTVEWKDITNDDVAEIVVITLSQGDPGNVCGLLQGCQLSQRLLAYDWNGGNTAKIADVTGCVAQDLHSSVRLEDFDGDGQMEISATGRLYKEGDYPRDRDCWCELAYTPESQIYEWNGEEFVLAVQGR
jgi:hypothetical protein